MTTLWSTIYTRIPVAKIYNGVSEESLKVNHQIADWPENPDIIYCVALYR